MLGLYGKMPAHGDFVRRGLADDFVKAWDAWCQAGLEAAREALAAAFPDAWATAPSWRFRLPGGACGAGPVAGLFVPSADGVGRTFPLMVGTMLGDSPLPPSRSWYEAMADGTRSALQARLAADAFLTHVGQTVAETTLAPSESLPEEGWWLDDEAIWCLPELPQVNDFRILVQGGA